MDLGFITLPMATVTKGHGMKAVNKVLACIPFEAAIQDAVNGIVAILRLPYHP